MTGGFVTYPPPTVVYIHNHVTSASTRTANPLGWFWGSPTTYPQIQSRYTPPALLHVSPSTPLLLPEFNPKRTHAPTQRRTGPVHPKSVKERQGPSNQGFSPKGETPTCTIARVHAPTREAVCVRIRLPKTTAGPPVHAPTHPLFHDPTIQLPHACCCPDQYTNCR